MVGRILEGLRHTEVLVVDNLVGCTLGVDLGVGTLERNLEGIDCKGLTLS